MTIPKFRFYLDWCNEVLAVTGIIFKENEIMVTIRNSYREDGFMPLTSGILMQSTGLTDKNRKEIFEGDIVRLVEKDRIENIGPVSFRDGAFGANPCGFVPFNWIIDSGLDITIEIIGNIYENPEFLKGQ